MENYFWATSRDAADRKRGRRTEIPPFFHRSEPELTGMRRSLSRDNPFAADGELSRTADLILASSTFSRQYISVVDPDLHPSTSSLPQTPFPLPPTDPITIVSTTTPVSGSPRRVSFAPNTHAPIHTTPHSRTQQTTQALAPTNIHKTTTNEEITREANQSRRSVLTQQTSQRIPPVIPIQTTSRWTNSWPRVTTRPTITHAVTQQATTKEVTPHVSVWDSAEVANDDVSSGVVAIATVQRRVLDEVVKVTLDRSQEVTVTYVAVRGAADTSSESEDTITPEAEDPTDEIQLPVGGAEGQGQDVIPLQSPEEVPGEIEGQSAVHGHCEPHSQVRGHCQGDACQLDDFEWVDADGVIIEEEKSLLNDVMSALEKGGFSRDILMTGGGLAQAAATGDSKYLDSRCMEARLVYKEDVVSVQPTGEADSLTRMEVQTLTRSPRRIFSVPTGTKRSETSGNETEIFPGDHVSAETVAIATSDAVKSRVNNDVTEDFAACQTSSQDRHLAETEDSKRNSKVETGLERATGKERGTSNSHPEENPNTKTKPRPGDGKVLRRIIDIRYIIEREKPSSGTVPSGAEQFPITSIRARMEPPAFPVPERDGPTSGRFVRGRGNLTEDRAIDTESGDDCDTVDCPQRMDDGKAPVKSLKRKLLCCSVH